MVTRRLTNAFTPLLRVARYLYLVYLSFGKECIMKLFSSLLLLLAILVIGYAGSFANKSREQIKIKLCDDYISLLEDPSSPLTDEQHLLLRQFCLDNLLRDGIVPLIDKDRMAKAFYFIQSGASPNAGGE